MVFDDADTLAEAIIERVGKEIVLALPLGIGKANHIANALYQCALRESELRLTIITALTLEMPPLRSELERRFLAPAQQRLFGDYPGLDYASALRSDSLPENVQVHEFFMQAGQWLHSPTAQQSFIPANYTHALDYIIDKGVNVVAQLVAVGEEGSRYSLSCNPDITVDLLRRRRAGDCEFIFAAQANSELPFMEGEAVIDEGELDCLLQGEKNHFELFGIPSQPVTLQDQAIGIHVASLVRDGGTLQIGIGSVGDAVTQALLLRHREPEQFNRLCIDLTLDSADRHPETTPFTEGLYGLSEMFVEGFLELFEAGILKRKVDGAVLHGGFFAGSRRFYERLRELSAESRGQFRMHPVSFTNALYGDEDEKRASRIKASFVNNAMMATLRGAIVSDALEDGRVISGVGGQYNFAAQAFALQDARFIVCLNATREQRGKTLSNIVFSYGHETIPWHLRDLIVTEYGVADLRGRSESEVVEAMLKIADSRFQEGLLSAARNANKIAQNWQIPSRYRNNLPARITGTLGAAREAQLLPEFPLGTEFTVEERRLLPVMQLIKQQSHSRAALASLVFSGLSYSPDEEDESCLARLKLRQPATIKERLLNLLIRGAIKKSRAASGESPPMPE